MLLVRGGTVVDPTRDAGVDPTDHGNAPADVWIRGEHVVAPEDVPGPPDRVIDAGGGTVMAGGIDPHTHIGGGKLTLARMLLEPDFRSPAGDHLPEGWTGQHPELCAYLPAAPVAASRYLDMGFTTCFEPAVIASNARSAHAEMADCRGLDTGGYVLLGNEPPLLAMIRDGCDQRVINDYVLWMVAATGSIAVKVVNAGGIDAFKFACRSLDVDETHPTYGVTPRQIVGRLARAVHEIGLRHPLHVHCSNLGVPGNIDSTLATIDAADGYPIHLAHAQFHVYGRTDGGITSAAARLADAVNASTHVSVDVGQVMFGQTVTLSADAMHQYDNLPLATPRKGVVSDIECQSGCGVVPFRYRKRRWVNAVQWMAGLELFLMIDDPSRVWLTTDHPNGAPFTTYPQLIRLLGDRTYREAAMRELAPELADAGQLAGVDREYSPHDIAAMTRSGPAAALGLADRGHLRPGAVADVVVYGDDDNLERRFASPRFVIRRGRVVRGEGAESPAGGQRTLVADLPVDVGDTASFARYVDDLPYRPDTVWIGDDEWPGIGTERIATGMRS